MDDTESAKPSKATEPDWTVIFGELERQLPELQIKTIEQSSVSNQIETKTLYPVSQELRPELTTAFRLIEEGLALVALAIKEEREGDMISSDDAINRLQALLPELFCCRSISDGFGAIINAVYHSIQNMQGTPLNADQLHALRKILNRVNTEPFLTYEEAVDEIITLEKVGFEVEPSYFKYAADVLDE
jgi:hypothetical protein